MLAFSAFVVETEPNLNTAFRLSLTLAGSYSVYQHEPQRRKPSRSSRQTFQGTHGIPMKGSARTILLRSCVSVFVQLSIAVSD